MAVRDREGLAPGEEFEAEVDSLTQRQIQVRFCRGSLDARIPSCPGVTTINFALRQEYDSQL